MFNQNEWYNFNFAKQRDVECTPGFSDEDKDVRMNEKEASDSNFHRSRFLSTADGIN